MPLPPCWPLLLGLTAAPVPLAPPADSQTSCPVPRLTWQSTASLAATDRAGHRVQIARDAAFDDVVRSADLPAVISWYVPREGLAPGVWWWRVGHLPTAGGEPEWSAAQRFEVIAPAVHRVRLGSSFAEIQETVAAASRQPPAKVVFEPGVYRLEPDQHRQLFRLEGVSDLELDGGGASFVMTQPSALAALTECHRVTLRNFSFDLDPLPFTAIAVDAVDPAAGTITGNLLPGHPRPDDWPAFTRDRKGLVVSPDEGYAVKREAILVLAHHGWEEPAPRRYRFRFDPPRLAGAFAPGDVYVLDPRWNQEAGGHGFVAFGGSDITLLEVTIRASANECLGSFYSDRLALLGVRLERPEGRALGVNNGGNNHHNARTGPWIEDCLFENTGDDICHVNGYAMSVIAQPSEREILIPIATPYDQYCQPSRCDLRVGDRLQFHQRDPGTDLQERRITAVTVDGDLLRVALDSQLAGLTLGTLRGGRPAENDRLTVAYNASRSCNQFVFRGNVCRRGRRVGVLAKGSGGWIDGNRFADLGGGGVEFWNAPFEGLGAEDYVVSGNQILDCLRLARRHAGIWAISFRPDGARLHRNLRITGNTIRGPVGPAMDLGDAAGVVLDDNLIADGLAVVHRNMLGLVRAGQDEPR